MASPDKVLLPQDAIPTAYSLELSPDLVGLTYHCKETITLQVVRSVDKMVLHSKEISVVSASFAGAGEKLACVGISYDLTLHTVTLTFDKPMPLGEGILSLSFNGILNGDMAGFYKSAYTDAAGNKKIMASTQFEALDARRAFPCVDEPAVKATFSVTLIVQQHLTAISNMPEISTQHLANGTKKVCFDVSPKMSTYLLAWAVGEFDMVQATSKGNVTIRIYSPPGRAEQGRFALDCGVRALDFYDEFFAIPYPLPKLDMICITEFAMGAMENWGLVTYRYPLSFSLWLYVPFFDPPITLNSHPHLHPQRSRAHDRRGEGLAAGQAGAPPAQCHQSLLSNRTDH